MSSRLDLHPSATTVKIDVGGSTLTVSVIALEGGGGALEMTDDVSCTTLRTLLTREQKQKLIDGLAPGRGDL